jgi:hypothetical protein
LDTITLELVVTLDTVTLELVVTLDTVTWDWEPVLNFVFHDDSGGKQYVTS